MINYDTRGRFSIMFALKGSVGPIIAGYVTVLGIWAALVVALYKYTALQFEFGIAAHTMVGVALGLLLVFRTNTAYGRYWEGRCQLGQLSVAVRNLSLRTNSVVPVECVDYRETMAKLIEAYVLVVKETIQGNADGSYREFLPESSVDHINRFSNPPYGILSVLSDMSRDLVKNNWVEPPEYNAFSSDVNQCLASFRALCRIRSTPMPFAYVNHLKIFMFLYFITLPFALVSLFGWGAVVVNVAIAYVLVGIEEIGVEIEDPFGDDPNDLPVEQICDQICTDVREVLIGTGAK